MLNLYYNFTHRIGGQPHCPYPVYAKIAISHAVGPTRLQILETAGSSLSEHEIFSAEHIHTEIQPFEQAVVSTGMHSLASLPSQDASQAENADEHPNCPVAHHQKAGQQHSHHQTMRSATVVNLAALHGGTVLDQLLWKNIPSQRIKSNTIIMIISINLLETWWLWLAKVFFAPLVASKTLSPMTAWQVACSSSEI